MNIMTPMAYHNRYPLSTLVCTFSEDPSYSYLEAEHGTIPFIVETVTYYQSSWQRVNGDPHGQTAERESPDPLGDETLSFNFPDRAGTYEVSLWSHDLSGKPCTIIVHILTVEQVQIIAFISYMY